MKRHEKIKVRITNSNGWYKKGTIHTVRNYITFDYLDGGPHFEIEPGMYGIKLNDCEVLEPKDDIIKIGGRKYDRSEVESALKNLKPID